MFGFLCKLGFVSVLDDGNIRRSSEELHRRLFQVSFNSLMLSATGTWLLMSISEDFLIFEINS